jgi:hypothetical protein
MSINQPTVWFSCFLDDSLCITTQYKNGITNESDNLISRVVKTSIGAALDYQIYHTQQYVDEHGELLAFANVDQLLEWEHSQKYGKALYKLIVKQLWRVLLALIVIPTLTIISGSIIWAIYVVIASPEITETPDFVIWITIIMIFVFYMAWTIRFNKPQTVESRKKRKAKETKEEWNPFLPPN